MMLPTCFSALIILMNGLETSALPIEWKNKKAIKKVKENKTFLQTTIFSIPLMFCMKYYSSELTVK